MQLLRMLLMVPQQNGNVLFSAFAENTEAPGFSQVQNWCHGMVEILQLNTSESSWWSPQGNQWRKAESDGSMLFPEAKKKHLFCLVHVQRQIPCSASVHKWLHLQSVCWLICLADETRHSRVNSEPDAIQAVHWCTVVSQQSGQLWTESTVLFSAQCGGDAAPDQRSAGFSYRWRRSGPAVFLITFQGMIVLNVERKSIKDIKMDIFCMSMRVRTTWRVVIMVLSSWDDMQNEGVPVSGAAGSWCASWWACWGT